MASSETRKSAKKATNKTESLSLVKGLVVALDAKKAGNLRVLSVGEHSSITDYIIVASGQANPHLRALRIEAERVLDAAGAPIAGIETSEGSGWLVFDAYQIMIHLFMPEQREVYQLEQLWRDAEELDVAQFLAPPAQPKQAVKKVAAKKASVKKAAAKKTPVKKAAVKKAVVKKVATKKVTTKKVTAKKTATKTVVKKAAKKGVKKKTS